MKSEKYAFWITLRSLGSMRQDKAELCMYIKIYCSILLSTSVSPKQLCASTAQPIEGAKGPYYGM